MRLNVTLDRDEDGVWVVECPSIPGCVSQGKTREEAIENIKDAIRLCLEIRAERGMELLEMRRPLLQAARGIVARP
jgi:predicted RNase H-like HicB family nuclease